MRKIAVVSVGRSDYGLYRPILRRLVADPELELQLVVSGAHFSERFGSTFREIESDGFTIAQRLPLADSDEAPQSIPRLMGQALALFGDAFARLRPDLLLVLGDRAEMHSAALAALPLRLPVAHIHGGELTFGAIDDALRHSMTKLCHLHFPATEPYAARIRQMGEESWRVVVSGAPGLDNLADFERSTLAEFATRRELALTQPPLLVTFHPVTLEAEHAEWQLTEFFAALRTVAFPILFTLPNADTGHESIIRAIREFAGTKTNVFVVPNLGTRDYFGAMSWSAAMVGNSSSGIIEASSFELPVVNIGNRQAGRTRAANVIDCAHDREAVAAAIGAAVAPSFRASLKGLQNPYGDGQASERIVSWLKRVELGDKLLVKKFVDLA